MSEPEFLTDSRLTFILFGGKGGVGKTSSATATALRLAEQAGRSVLLVSTDPAHSVVDVLGVEANSPLLGRLQVEELSAEAQLDRFRREHGGQLRKIAERGTFLDSEDIERFLSLSLPGMDEFFALLEISRWADEKRADTIVVDTAPTGHTLRLLNMPALLGNWVAMLNTLLAKHRYMRRVFTMARPSQADELDEFLDDFSRTVSRAEAQLRDPEHTRFVPIMIAEELAVRETGRLLSELDRLQIAASEIVVNKVSPPGACARCALARSQEMQALASLPSEFAGRKLFGVPWYAEEVRGLNALRTFWRTSGELRADEGRATGGTRVAAKVDAPPPLPPPSLRLLVFAGKGGVGKTTLACATATRLARQQQAPDILVFSTDPAHSLGDCLDVVVGNTPVHVADHLTALEIDAEADFEKLKLDYQREIDAFLKTAFHSLDITFDREVMERILDLSPPGLDEIMALTSAMQFMTSGEYGLLVLDSAPTGHLIRLLEMPELIDQWLKAFFEVLIKYRDVFHPGGLADRLVAMSRDLKHFRKTLVDPQRAAIHAVAILTEVALEETKDLLASCARMGVDVPVLFLNMATTPEGGDCSVCSARLTQEKQLRERFRQMTQVKQQAVVYRQAQPRGLEQLQELGNALYSGGLSMQ